MLRLIGNIIWLVLGGLEAAFAYFVAGIVCFLLIVTIPFGVQAFKLGIYTLWPFGTRLQRVARDPLSGLLAVIGNVIWLVLFGWWLALIHLVAAIFSALTIIGIPFAIGHLKLLRASLAPFGYRVVPWTGDGDLIRPLG